MHGHRWTVEVEFAGTPKRTSGTLIDFGLLKELVKQTADKLDHTLLNDRISNPTAENLALYFKNLLTDALFSLKLYSITIHETPDSWARIINP